MKMAASPPIKPPRGVKHVKETSGLLMSVIRTLSASENNEQRDREKAKLEKEYKRSDQRLDELVSGHDGELTQVMQLFGKLSTQVTTSRERIHAVKENLHACKHLLRCRRDELKKLWLEGIEHKHVLQLLEEIDQLRKVPSQLNSLLSKKHYLHATKMLVSAIALGQGNLKDVDALREVRQDLETKKQNLRTKLLEDLSRHVYVQSTQDVFTLRRQGSGRELFGSPFQRSEIRRSFNERVESKVKKNLLDAMQASEGLFVKSSSADDVIEDLRVMDPEANSQHFIAIIIECLALLNKVPESVEYMKVQIQTELLSIITRTTQQVMESPPLLPQNHFSSNNQTVLDGLISTNNNKLNNLDEATKHGLLYDLLETIFEQFRLVAAAHSTVLKCLQKTVQRHKINTKLYEISDFWSRAQAVMQLLLTDYLDIQNISEPQPSSTFIEQTNDINAFFSRRKVQSKKRTSLFKFDNSSHAISINNYLKEKGQDIIDSGNGTDVVGKPRQQKREKLLVCSPTPNNITLIFLPLNKFIEEIERELGYKSGSQCTLNAFLADYIKEVYLGRHHSTISANVDAVTKSHDAWRCIISPEIMKEMSLTRPLLQSTVTVDNCIFETGKLMSALPVYAENFFSVVCMVLKQYRETCQAAYRGIVQPDTEDKRICSAAWLKDEDISRFLKTLPNWIDLKSQQLSDLRVNVRRSGRQQEPSEEESPAEIRQRNLREAEILASNLGEGGINAHEILSDVMVLKGLAILQESMEWFSARMIQFGNNLRRSSTLSPNATNGVIMNGPETPIVKENSVKCLINLAQEFDELANTCLLVLHLEVRVQCFHYLLPRGDSYSRYYGTESRDSHEPDNKVLELTKVLVSVDEAMNATLHPRKTKYIFEGLGHLTAKILISASQYMDRIDEAGIQRMCRNVFALQQTLTNVTMTREVALDYAKHYYEMLYLEPEEILNGIIEKGAQFSELEYMNAFQLIHRSRNGGKDPTAINGHLQRLSDILGDVGVTV